MTTPRGTARDTEENPMTTAPRCQFEPYGRDCPNTATVVVLVTGAGLPPAAVPTCPDCLPCWNEDVQATARPLDDEPPAPAPPSAFEVSCWVADHIGTVGAGLASQALVLAEETGEACRAAVKRAEGIRGTAEQWTAALRQEIGDVALTALGAAGRLGMDGTELIEDAELHTRWRAQRPTLHLLAEAARYAGSAASALARREEEGQVTACGRWDFYAEQAFSDLLVLLTLAAQVAQAEGWTLAAVVVDRWAEITGRDPRAERGPDTDHPAGPDVPAPAGRRRRRFGLRRALVGVSAAALLCAGAGVATAAPTLAPTRGDSTAALATIDGGSYRHVYSDGYRTDWLDAGDEASVTLAESDEVIEVRGVGATCRITAADGTVLDTDRAGVLRHARCGGA